MMLTAFFAADKNLYSKLYIIIHDVYIVVI